MFLSDMPLSELRPLFLLFTIIYYLLLLLYLLLFYYLESQYIHRLVWSTTFWSKSTDWLLWSHLVEHQISNLFI